MEALLAKQIINSQRIEMNTRLVKNVLNDAHQTAKFWDHFARETDELADKGFTWGNFILAALYGTGFVLSGAKTLNSLDTAINQWQPLDVKIPATPIPAVLQMPIQRGRQFQLRPYRKPICFNQ